MVSPDLHRRWAARYLAHREARRRAREVARVTLLIVVVACATLALAGHRALPECLGALVCIERQSPMADAQ